MKMKKMLALALSATMVMGVSVPVMADDPTVTAPIYSFETLDVVVPTTYEVAFNPEGLTVKTGDSATSTDQILSRSYGMINKGNKDQVFTVALKVEDQNTGANKVTFVDSADEVRNAKDGEYKIHLQAIPADTTEVKVGSTPASATGTTTAADLNNVTMADASGKEVTLKSGENEIAFKLDKAKYDPKNGSELTLGGSATNDVKSNFELTNLAANGKGITAFRFGGSMNTKANWSKLTSGIKITAVYGNEVATSDATVISGTGAMVKVGPKITINNTGLITITGLTAEKNFESLTIENANGEYDVKVDVVTWIEDEFSMENGGTLKCQLGDSWLNSLRGITGKINLNLTDNTIITINTNIPA